MSTTLHILIIASGSEMLLVESDKSLPKVTINFPIDEANKKTQIEAFLKGTDKIKDLTIDYSRFSFCDTASPSVIGSSKCAILKVSSDEKKKIEENTTYKFYVTYEIDTSTKARKINSSIASEADRDTFFAAFNYITDKDGNKLDKCINASPEPPKKLVTETFKFYRPVLPFHLLFNNPLLPYLTFPNRPPVVSSIFSPFINPRPTVPMKSELVPIFSSFPTVVSPFISPAGSPYSSRESSPRINPRFDGQRIPQVPIVPRSKLSPRSKRMLDMGGGYYDKYMKYKTKYMNLKKSLN